MSISSSWSSASPTLRLELGGSRLQSAILITMGVLAAFGLFLTDIPLVPALAIAPLCVACGAWLARRERRRVKHVLLLRADGSVRLDGQPVDRFGVEWRGPLACLSWSHGSRREHDVAWPDVLDATQRRELRLWTLAHRSDAATVAVAP